MEYTSSLPSPSPTPCDAKAEMRCRTTRGGFHSALSDLALGPGALELFAWACVEDTIFVQGVLRGCGGAAECKLWCCFKTLW